MDNIINSLFQLKEREGFVGKEIAKEVVRELVKQYKDDFPNGGNPLTMYSFGISMERIFQISKSRGIDITREELSSVVMKEALFK